MSGDANRSNEDEFDGDEFDEDGFDEDEIPELTEAEEQDVMMGLFKEVARRLRPDLHPPMEAEPLEVGRNDPCPCGSGKKYKRCHGGGG